MICYFSGTGNSQLAANQIAEATDDCIFSINHSLKNGALENLHSEKPFVFVVPTYAWRIPRMVEQWVRNTKFTGSRDAYFVLTCGGGCGNAAAFAHKLCAKKDFVCRGLASVIMPENYLALYPTPDKAEALSILERAKPQIDSLADQIRKNQPFSDAKPSFASRLESGLINPLFYRFVVGDRGFSVSNACVSCGLCSRRCPLDNIAMKNGKPKWRGNCTHCMACIGGCPTEAIEYKRKSEGRPRYYIMKD